MKSHAGAFTRSPFGEEFLPLRQFPPAQMNPRSDGRLTLRDPERPQRQEVVRHRREWLIDPGNVMGVEVAPPPP